MEKYLAQNKSSLEIMFELTKLSNLKIMIKNNDKK